jgi:2-oxoglutarate dehydrogenase E2 component (dihydrolipoamide succinyltransferase)
MKVDMVMPQMGESITEGKILKWHKKIGDKILKDETVLEISTDKVDSEIPSPVSGFVAELLATEGQTVAVGTLIARIETDTTAASSAPEGKQYEPIKNVVKETIQTEVAIIKKDEKQKITGERFYSPVVKNIAKVEGISQSELDSIDGSGLDGRITKDDVLVYLDKRSKGQITSKTQSVLVPKTVTHVAYVYNKERSEVLPMNNVRKLTADHMRRSLDTSAHVYSLTEINMHRVVKFKQLHQKEFESKESFKLTYTPFIIEAMVKSVKDFPMINVSVDGASIIKKNYINLGMAVSIENNSALIVPVIRDADMLNLTGLARAVRDLADRSRNKKLRPEEIQDGTITLTNMGGFGSLIGFPIINQPQVAILAIGAITKRPVVIESTDGDTIGIRSMMFAALSYDHRVVDGALGASYLERVRHYLENFDMNTPL